MKVCPTNGLHPAMTEAGPEGIWTPMLVGKIGYCEYYCSLCTQVCPTGAIQELTIEEKNKLKMGTAWVDKNTASPGNSVIPASSAKSTALLHPRPYIFAKTWYLQLTARLFKSSFLMWTSRGVLGAESAKTNARLKETRLSESLPQASLAPLKIRFYSGSNLYPRSFIHQRILVTHYSFFR